MTLPKLFGSYLLHYRLSQSETSEVMMAQTLGDFPRICVVKRLRPELSTLPDFEERFRKDAALLLRLIHGNVVQVLEVGVVDGQPFLAMEHIDGIDVRELVADIPHRGPLAPEVALYVGLEMCEAAAYICQRRREHVSAEGLTFSHAWPLDVMVSFDGVIKVISPGSVGALRLGQRSVSQVMRSPGYLAPEVLLKAPLDARSDVFSVGVVLWGMLNGSPLIPDAEGYIKQVIERRWRAPLITRKDVPGDVIRMLSQMLDLDPEKRPVTPEAVRACLVSGLRRIAPAFGSGQMARLLLGRYTQRIGLTDELTDKLIKRAATVQAQPSTHPVGHTLTYGRAIDVKRPVPQPIELKPGDRIPGTRYRMVRPLGRGGSSEVFAAQHIDLDRQAAIKILAPELATEQSAITCFRLEARVCSRIGHPNIIDVIDFGELHDGRFFFAMELLEGQSLGDLLGVHRQLPATQAIPIFRQIAKALQAAHEHGIIHRDLKPENVMVVRKERRQNFVKVLDFGVMAFAADQSAERVGTPGYMAPEQINRERATPQTDVYAMGAALYEVLSAELPYGGETMEEYHAQQCCGPPPALRSRRRGADVHPALERVAHRALERDPQLRHPSAADFEADLVRAQREAGIVTEWDDLPLPEVLRDTRDGAGRSTRTAELKRARARQLQIGLLGGILGLLLLVGLALLGTRGLFSRPSLPHPLAGAGKRHATAALTAQPTTPPQADETNRPPDTNHRKAPHGADTPPGDLPHVAGPAHASHLASQKAADHPPAAAQPRPISRREAPAAARRAHSDSLLQQGQQLLQRRHLADAEQRFEGALSADPTSARAELGLASVAFQRARYDDAVKYARRAVALDHGLARAHLLLGDAYAKLLRRDEARVAWRRALALDPQNVVATTRLARAGLTPHSADPAAAE